jgi:hypothetical protein
MVYKALKHGSTYTIDYLEHPISSILIFGHYDFIVFNWHHQTTPDITHDVLSAINIPKYTVVTECAPDNPVPITPKWFDGYLVLDPTVEDKGQIWGMPRPLETYDPEPRTTRQVPVIGSFGFATAGKRFDLIIDQANKEFNEAIIRFNIPEATYVPSAAHIALESNLKKLAKREIDLQITHDYLSKQELIEWCAYNDLNAFFYYRNMTGLAAVTDQAISAQRPILVTEDYTFRHIHPYMDPYPKMSMKEALTTVDPVRHMYKDWHPTQFAKKFERILANG